MALINLKVTTPYGVKLEEFVESIHVNTSGGYVTILPNHYPLIATVVPCVCSIKDEEGETKYYFVSTGILKVNVENTQLIVSAFEFSEDIDIERAKKAKERAEKRLASYDKNVDQERAEIALKRALARIKASEYK